MPATPVEAHRRSSSAATASSRADGVTVATLDVERNERPDRFEKAAEARNGGLCPSTPRTRACIANSANRRFRCRTAVRHLVERAPLRQVTSGCRPAEQQVGSPFAANPRIQAHFPATDGRNSRAWRAVEISGTRRAAPARRPIARTALRGRRCLLPARRGEDRIRAVSIALCVVVLHFFAQLSCAFSRRLPIHMAASASVNLHVQQCCTSRPRTWRRLCSEWGFQVGFFTGSQS